MKYSSWSTVKLLYLFDVFGQIGQQQKVHNHKIDAIKILGKLLTSDPDQSIQHNYVSATPCMINVQRLINFQRPIGIHVVATPFSVYISLAYNQDKLQWRTMMFNM